VQRFLWGKDRGISTFAVSTVGNVLAYAAKVRPPSLSLTPFSPTDWTLFIFYTLLSAASVDRFQQHPTCQRSQTPSWLSRVSSRRCGDWERKRSAVAEWSR
jgi:hypothetical protein